MTKVNSLERDIINYGVVLNYPKGAYIFDFRDLMLSCPRALEFGNALYEKIQDYKFDYVVCYGIGGLVTCNMLRAAALHRGYNLRMLYVRDQRKTYALKKLIEGDEIIQNPRVVLIDDAISTGTSIDKCLEALAEYSPVLVARVIILDNGAAGTRGMRLRGETVHTLFHRRDIGMSREKPPHTACHVVWIDVDVHVKDQDAMRAKPVYDKVNDLLYVGTDQFKLICYQASLGKRLWETHVGNANYKGIASTPAYKNGLIYFGAYDGVARCVDTEGKTIWNSLIGEAIHGSPFLDDNFSYWSVETWYGETPGGKVISLDSYGAKRWEFITRHYTPGSPIVDNGKVYCPSNEDVLYCLDARTGEKLWEAKTNGQVKGWPTVVAGKVYTFSNTAMFECFDAETGIALWKDIAGKESNHVQPMLVTGDILAVTTLQGFVVGYDTLYRERAWLQRFSHPIIGSVIPFTRKEKYFLVQLTNGEIHICEGKTGKKVAWFGTNLRCQTPPALADDNILYVNSLHMGLVCYNIEELLNKCNL